MQRYKWLGGAALVPTTDDGDYVLYYDAMVEIGRLTALACERQEIIEEQMQEIAALKHERDGYLNGQQQMQDTCSRLQDSIAKYAEERKAMKDLREHHEAQTEDYDEIAALTESRDEWNRQWRLMEAAEKKAEEQIVALEAEVELKDKQNAELRERLNKSWEREDAQGHDFLRLTVTIADLKEEKAKEFFACAKLMGEKKEEIVTLKAEMERLREVLKRIRDWPYDIKVQLLRKLMESKDWHYFIGLISNDWNGPNGIIIDNFLSRYIADPIRLHPGKLRDAVWEWLYRKWLYRKGK